MSFSVFNIFQPRDADHGAQAASDTPLANSSDEASFIVGKISQKSRARFELRKLKLCAEEAAPPQDEVPATPRVKRRKISHTEHYGLRSDSDTDSVDGLALSGGETPSKASVKKVTNTRKVVRLAWLQDSMSKGLVLDYGDYLIFEALKAPSTPGKGPQLDAPRSTFIHPPNEAFIEKLKEVRELRAMTGDGVGVRAYSSAIASLSAYPYKLKSPLELTRLPGCGEKIGLLFAEFEEIGQLSEIQRAESDEKLVAIRIFYNIFGVSAVTAEEFYRRGWRDLDDVVDYGWKTINRSQQIGVKYYDEFLQKIPRPETESIAKTVLEHARKLRPGFQMTIVGGYRRGKILSGDVDLMLSHYDEEATHAFVDKLVVSLEEDKYITHTLSLSIHNSERGQRPTSFKGASSGGTGFDTLDKALVVWQDPNFKSTDPSDKNPNTHRRVDILISPWRTVGCAVLGWSSETTFQRDLRRYCKYEKNLKFDSSGIRSREPPYNWVDMEDGERGRAETMEEAEKRVFEGLGLEWKPPEERCTG
ncbi:hypothetical protein VSDG_07211 [Cytospora chrysosperma]|uniref:DNA polymerase n=1 Tax=Cytospora chrysosperma TaxID=252740 RepID=A0A423VK87_CYTCH|nr:hypothetical protein VSDG_07211 [Valsa sordida]